MQTQLFSFFVMALLLVGCSKAPHTTESSQPATNAYRFPDDPIWQMREKTELIVVHHSATKHDSVATIRRFHQSSEREFNDIGYHFVITNGNGGPDGVVHAGRSEMSIGAHDNHDRRNWRSVGICLIGGNVFTDKQRDALAGKLKELCKKYSIEPSTNTIVPHRTGVPNRGADCPGPGLDLADIIRRVAKSD